MPACAGMTVLLLVLLCGPALAKSSCYTRDEAEAEQGVRIHSELMVIGLNCQHLYKTGNGKNLYQAYREFSAAHGPLFAGYETELLKFFKDQGAKDPELALHDLRTAFANKISSDAAKMRPDIFCYRYAPRIEQASAMDEAALHKWAGKFFDDHPISYPICGQ